MLQAGRWQVRVPFRSIDKTIDEWWIGTDEEGKCGNSIEIISRNFLGGIEEKPRKTSYQVSWPRCELSTSRIQVWSIVSRPTCSVLVLSGSGDFELGSETGALCSLCKVLDAYTDVGLARDGTVVMQSLGHPSRCNILSRESAAPLPLTPGTSQTEMCTWMLGLQPHSYSVRYKFCT
jgi:hypothetical protein